MGIPAFFRWLTLRYPKIVMQIDQSSEEVSVDNLYFDLNCIIHPCAHPVNAPQPQTEEQMFNSIFEYVDYVIELIKPKQMVFFAIDGTAPRAKLNQQRSRRFRAAIEEFNENQQKYENQDTIDSFQFDKNSITPGTEFMERLQT